MTGRTEKEIASTKKMQEKLKELPKIFSEFYYYMCSTKSYTTVERYVAYVREFAEFFERRGHSKQFLQESCSARYQ